MHPLLANLIAAFDAIPGVHSIHLSTYRSEHQLGITTSTDAAAESLAETLGLAPPLKMSDRDRHWLSVGHYGADITIWLTGPMHAIAKTEAA